MMATRSAGALLADLKSHTGAIATALVSRNGLVVHAETLSGCHVETFALMCATVVGAADAASAEVGQSPPDRIVVVGGGSKLVMVPAGKQALLVAAVGGSSELRAVVAEVASLAQTLATGEPPAMDAHAQKTRVSTRCQDRTEQESTPGRDASCGPKAA
jgi:uncharacterized protein